MRTSVPEDVRICGPTPKSICFAPTSNLLRLGARRLRALDADGLLLARAALRNSCVNVRLPGRRLRHEFLCQRVTRLELTTNCAPTLTVGNWEDRQVSGVTTLVLT